MKLHWTLEPARKAACLVTLSAALAMQSPRLLAAAPTLETAPGGAPVVLVVPDTASAWSKAAKLPLTTAVIAYLNSPELGANTEYQQFKLDIAKVEQAVGFNLTADELLGNVFSSLEVVGQRSATGSGNAIVRLGVKDAAKAGKLMDQFESKDWVLGKLMSDEKTADTASTGTVETTEKIDITGARAVNTYKTTDMAAPSETFVGLNKDYLVVAETKEQLEQNLAAATTGQKLDTNADYAKLKSKVATDGADALLWADMDNAAAGAGGPLAMLKALPGMTQSNKSLMALNIVEGGLQANGASTADPTLTAPNVKPASLAGLGVIAEQPLAGMSYGLVDGKSFYQLGNQMLGALSGGAASGEPSPLAGFETATGISIENELVPAMGQEGVFTLNNFQPNPLMPMMPVVDLNIALQIADEAKMKTVLDKLEKYLEKTAAAAGNMAGGANGAPAEPAAFKVINTTHGEVHTLQTAIPVVNPSYGIKKGFVVWGISESSVEAALGRLDTPPSAESGFRKLAQDKDVFTAGSVDVKAIVEKVITPLLPMISGGNPEAPQVAAFFSNVVSHIGTINMAEHLDEKLAVSKIEVKMQ